MSALVISAFPACGKSFYYNTHSNYAGGCYKANGSNILDSDSSQFSWIYNEDGTKERNPEFPANYIQHIRENLDRQDIIFVSSHKPVRGALYNAKIKFALVYPTYSMKDVWKQRILNRGSSEEFCKLIMDNWDDWVADCMHDELASSGYILTEEHPYLDEFVVERVRCFMRCQGYV